MATLTAKITIKGTRPLWWHHFTEAALPLERQERTGVAGNDPEEWRATVMATKQGQLYLEGTYFFSCLREAARYTRIGRGSLQKSVSATLQVIEERVMLDRWFPDWPKDEQIFDARTESPPPRDAELPVYLDVRGVRNPSTKARNVRYRVAVPPGWMCTFHITFESTIVDRQQMEAVVLDAGKLVGIGNGRTIGMGRFAIQSFEILEE